MAEHELSQFSSADLRERMESRLAHLHYTEKFHGRHAGEYDFLETVLADDILEDDGSSGTFKDDVEQSFRNSATESFAQECRKVSAGGCGDSRTVGGTSCSPQLLTGGIPSTESPSTPLLPNAELLEFSHGGYDGGTEIGFDGTWNPMKFSRIMEIFEKGKLQAEGIQKGLEGFPITLEGEDVLVMPTGGRVGGLLYKYRIIGGGVEFLFHSNPPENRQPVRVRYFSESVQGSRNRFYDAHYGFVMRYLKRLGLVVHADKPSRVDMQILIDVPMVDFCRFRFANQIVRKVRKRAYFGVVDIVDETMTWGNLPKVQVQFYDKGKELRSKKANIVKEADFIARCVGDEWFNSGRPITRIEFRLGREALKSFGVNTVDDLRQRERGIVDLLTSDWIRILKEPKVRGHESAAALHPVWERVRSLFMEHFSGSEVADVKWERKRDLHCDPAALERQALGCLSKSLAARFGAQSSRSDSIELANGWVDRVQNELHDKINSHAEHTRIKTGIELGVKAYDSASYDEELDRAVMDRKARDKVREFVQSLEGSR